MAEGLAKPPGGGFGTLWSATPVESDRPQWGRTDGGACFLTCCSSSLSSRRSRLARLLCPLDPFGWRHASGGFLSALSPAKASPFGALPSEVIQHVRRQFTACHVHILHRVLDCEGASPKRGSKL
jgi:hypothetical protein